MSGVLLGQKTAEAAARFFAAPQQVHGANLTPRRQPAGMGGAGKLFLTSSTISARTGTSTPWTPGNGTGTMLEFYNDAGTIRVRSTTTTGVTLRHMGTAAIATNRVVQCKLVDNEWLIDVDYC
jgi:hypothetical protein